MIFISWLHDVPLPTPLELLARRRAYPNGPGDAYPILYDPQPEGYPRQYRDATWKARGPNGETILHPVLQRRGAHTRCQKRPRSGEEMRAIRRRYGVGKPPTFLWCPVNNKECFYGNTQNCCGYGECRQKRSV